VVCSMAQVTQSAPAVAGSSHRLWLVGTAVIGLPEVSAQFDQAEWAQVGSTLVELVTGMCLLFGLIYRYLSVVIAVWRVLTHAEWASRSAWALYRILGGIWQYWMYMAWQGWRSCQPTLQWAPVEESPWRSRQLSLEWEPEASSRSAPTPPILGLGSSRGSWESEPDEVDMYDAQEFERRHAMASTRRQFENGQRILWRMMTSQSQPAMAAGTPPQGWSWWGSVGPSSNQAVVRNSNKEPGAGPRAQWRRKRRTTNSRMEPIKRTEGNLEYGCRSGTASGGSRHTPPRLWSWRGCIGFSWVSWTSRAQSLRLSSHALEITVILGRRHRRCGRDPTMVGQ